MKHGGAGDLAHHLASWAVIFGDAKRVPRAGGVIVAGRGMKREAGTASNLVTRRDQCQRLVAANVVTLFGQRQQRQNDGNADTPLERLVAVMRVKILGLCRRRLGRAGKADLPPVKQHWRLLR